MRRGRPPYPDVLTPREQEVLAFIREGLTNEQIGARLGISEHGAKYHVAEILSKLGVPNRQEAARWSPQQRVAPGLLGLLTRHAAVGALVVAGVGLIALATGVLLMNERSGGATTGGSQQAQQQEEALPPPPGVDDGPVRRIAYVERQGDQADIWTMNPDGTDKVQLTEALGSELSPSWSPEGRQIVYLMYTRESGRNSLMVMNSDGTGQRQLLADAGTATGELAWSPDGKRIAFASTLGGTAMNVFTINSDGSGLFALTSDNNSNTTPRWLEDGRRVVFSSGMGSTVIDADGSDRRQLLPRTGGIFVSVSADGVLAAVLRPVDFSNGAYRLDLINLEDGRTETLVSHVQRPQSPVAWSQDGKWLAFTENLDADTWVVNIVRPDGSDLTTLVSEIAVSDPGSRIDISVVGWMSDGTSLVYKFAEQTRIGHLRDRYCTVTLADMTKICFDTIFGLNEDGPTSPSLLLN